MLANHRLESPIAEQHLLLKIWKRLQQETGVHAGESVMPDEYLTASNPVQAGVLVGTTDVIYAMGMTDHLSDEEISGILAHELGHIDQDRRGIAAVNRESEAHADAFAAKHGYGEGLISALKTAQVFWGDTDDTTDGVHDANRTRIEFIRQHASISLDKAGQEV